jgi:Protein of unknown function (DUF3634)
VCVFWRARYTSKVGLFYAVIVVGALVWLIWAAGRAREVCVLSVRHGRLLIMRGALPESLLEAFTDIVGWAKVRRGRLSVLRDGGSARLVCSGLDAGAQQRARNVLGTYPMPRLLAAPSRGTRNLGQRLGLSWLGWWIKDRR